MPRQLRIATLRYEVIKNGTIVQEVERPWFLRWYSQEQFKRLLHSADFETKVVVGDDGEPATEDAPAFVFVALRPTASVEL